MLGRAIRALRSRMASLDSAAGMQELATMLDGTMSGDAAVRRNAEQRLRDAQGRPRFGVGLLHLLQQPSTDPHAMRIRQAAAVYFKNLVKEQWDVDPASSAFKPEDRVVIKTHLVNLMCSAPEAIRRPLSDSLTCISEHDFPYQWESLLPELVTKLASSDFAVINGVLETANSVFKRFRHVFESDEVLRPLEVALTHFQVPLLNFAKAAVAMLKAHAANPGALAEILRALRSVCRIFYSLNWLLLPEFFEENVDPWMRGIFLPLLQYKNPALVDDEEEAEAGPVEMVQAAVLANILLFSDKYDEQFAPYLPEFVEVVRGLLVSTGLQPKYDELVTAGMRFINSVAARPAHGAFFAGEEVLRALVEKVALPNLQVLEADVETFEENPTEFVRRDMEGSDSGTRRHGGVELLRTLARVHEARVFRLCETLLQQMMVQYGANPVANWRAKDTAITLVIALGAKTESRQRGVTELNPNLPVMDFLAAHVQPEVVAADINALPMLKAAAIKFVTTFRNQLPKETMVNLIPFIERFLTSRYPVLRSYAAAAIERLLATRAVVLSAAAAMASGAPHTVSAAPRLDRAAVLPLANSLLPKLFERLVDASVPDDEHVMRCLVRVISAVGGDVVPFVDHILAPLTAVLARVSANPTNPVFNHYLFEALAVVVRNACSAQPELVKTCEQKLLPHFETLLQRDVAEFTPYVFQLLGELLQYQPAGAIPAAFMGVLDLVLEPSVWGNRGNVPALVHLLQAYLRKYGAALTPRLEKVLGVFRKLLASKAYEQLAFALITDVVQRMPLEALAPSLGVVFGLVFTRLQQSSTQRLAKLSLLLACNVCGKFGGAVLVQAVEGVQPGVLNVVMEKVWLPVVPNVVLPFDRKTAGVGLAVLVGTREMLEPPRISLWSAVFSALVGLLLGAEARREGAAAETPADTGEVPDMEYSGEFSQLSFASRPSADPYPEVQDVRGLLAQQLQQLAREPHLAALLREGAKAASAEAQQFIAAAGVAAG